MDGSASRLLLREVRSGLGCGGNSIPLPALKITLGLLPRAGAGSGRSEGYALPLHSQPDLTTGSLARDTSCSFLLLW